MDKREELKRCPFCGSSASFTEDTSPIRDKVVWLVGCDSDDCLAMPLLCGNARKVDAAKAWNTRAASVDRKAIVREAKEVMSAALSRLRSKSNEPHVGGILCICRRCLAINVLEAGVVKLEVSE